MQSLKDLKITMLRFLGLIMWAPGHDWSRKVPKCFEPCILSVQTCIEILFGHQSVVFLTCRVHVSHMLFSLEHPRT